MRPPVISWLTTLALVAACDGAPSAVPAGHAALPLLETWPTEGLPPHFDETRGWTQYRTPSGGRTLVITRKGKPDLAAEVLASRIGFDPMFDTTVKNPRNTGWVEEAGACRLSVESKAFGWPLGAALLKFSFPDGADIACKKIKSAKIRLRTAHVLGPIMVAVHRLVGNWNSVVGDDTCATCDQSSSFLSKPFPTMPVIDAAIESSTGITESCEVYDLDVTALAKKWCDGTIPNDGVALQHQAYPPYMTPNPPDAFLAARFHSMETANPPVLIVDE